VSDTACALCVAFINGRWPRHSTRGSTPPPHRGNDAGGYSSDSTHRIRCVPHARHWGSPRSEVTPNSGQSSLPLPPLPPLPRLTSRKHCTVCTVHSAPSSSPSHSGQHAHEPTLATQQHSFGRYVGAMLGWQCWAGNAGLSWALTSEWLHLFGHMQVKSVTWRVIGTTQVILLARYLSGSWDKVRFSPCHPFTLSLSRFLHRPRLLSLALHAVRLTPSAFPLQSCAFLCRGGCSCN
jgi:hypothetical protein